MWQQRWFCVVHLSKMLESVMSVWRKKSFSDDGAISPGPQATWSCPPPSRWCSCEHGLHLLHPVVHITFLVLLSWKLLFWHQVVHQGSISSLCAISPVLGMVMMVVLASHLMMWHNCVRPHGDAQTGNRGVGWRCSPERSRCWCGGCGTAHLATRTFSIQRQRMLLSRRSLSFMMSLAMLNTEL